MKVDIWADVMCPFCYMGKRKFEAALQRFPHKQEVEVIWHSFQLDPALTPRPGEDLYSYLARIKGQSRKWSVKFNKQVADAAKKVGLVYDFDKVVVNNTFDAHRLIHQAKKSGLGAQAEERLFRAYFTEGRDIGDHKVLAALGAEIGLDPKDVKKMLESDAYADDVRKDEAEAGKLGADGVPFFLLNGKYTIIGAQEPALFLEALEKSFYEWKKKERPTE
ncbi:MAG: DsbA family oxidoreductase [Candidatus ainarchaeum sp.]|nr:DsbA family oxidoreductase [Candidatus ainarchaeum sp.]